MSALNTEGSDQEVRVGKEDSPRQDGQDKTPSPLGSYESPTNALLSERGRGAHSKDGQMLDPQLSNKPNVRKVSGKAQPRIESKNQSVQPPASIQTTKQ